VPCASCTVTVGVGLACARDPLWENRRHPMRLRTKHAAPLALAVAATIAPAVAILARGRTLAWRDSAQLFESLRPLIDEALRHGRLPLWDPHESLGVPLFAQLMHGVLHPVSAAAAFLAPGAGVDPLLVAYLAVAAAGAYVLAVVLGARPWAALAAGLAFGLSGYVLGLTSNLTYLAAGASAPWAIAGIVWASDGRLARLALAAAGVAVLHLAGDPQWTIAGLALGVLLVAVARGPRALWRAVAALTAGTLLAGVQLWPAWEFVRETSRASGLSPQERTEWALPLARLVELVVPGLFAGRAGVTFKDPVFAWLGGPACCGETMPFLPAVTVGGVALALAAAAVRSSRVALALGGAAALFLWASLGAAAGADGILHHLPVWGSFRYPEKLIGPFTLCVASLAALGCDRLAGSSPSDRRHAWAAAAAAAACVAALATVWPAPGILPEPATDLARAGIAAARERLTSGMLHPAVALALLAALLLLRPRLRPDAFAAAAALLVGVGGLAASPFALHAGVRGLADQGPVAALRSAAPQLPARIVTVSAADGTDRYALRTDLDDGDAMRDAAAGAGAPLYNARLRIDQLDGYSGLVPEATLRFAEAFSRGLGPGQWTAYRRYGITHAVLTDRSEDARAAAAGGRVILVDRNREVAVVEVPHRAWATFAEGTVEVASQEAALAAVIAAEQRDEPTVIVEGGPAPVGPGRVLSTERSPERIEVVADAAGPATLVVNDAFSRGWSATVDGRPVPIWRADGLVRAVPWPAGRHVLVMTYEAPGLRAGALVSLLGVLLVVGVVVYDVRSSRRRATP